MAITQLQAPAIAVDSNQGGFQSPPMPIFLLRYRGADHAVVGLAIVAALDEIPARRTAETANIQWPGALCTADELDPASVPAALIGRRLAIEDIKKAPAPSVRRRAPATARTG
jgi:hypothetical protein